MNELEQLQQASPSQFKQVSGQIAANLQSAAQTAQAHGDPAAANQLTQIGKEFSIPSQNGQLPDGHSLAQAIGGHHHHHFHGAHAFQDGGAQNDATDPLSIISNTLSSAGVK